MSKRGKVSCLQLLTLLRYFFFFSFFYKILPSKYNIKMDIMNHFKVPHNDVTQVGVYDELVKKAYLVKVICTSLNDNTCGTN